MAALAAIIFVCQGVAVAQTDTRVSATWKVQQYDITAALPTSDADRNLTAKAQLNLKNVSSRPATTLTLRISTAAEVSAVVLNGTSQEFTKGEEKLGSGSLQRLVIRMPSVAPNGNVSVTVDYKLNVKENSGLAAISAAGSQFLPLSFWYPTPNSWYFSRGADYGPVKIKVTAPSGSTSVAAGAESGGAFDSKLSTQPFFAVGDWEVQPAASGVSVFTPRSLDAHGKARAAELATIYSDASSFIAAILGPKPSEPARLVAVKKGAGFASGGTILFDEALLFRPKVDSHTVMTIAEAVAKMWLGGTAAVEDDGGGAIREGLSRYLATEFIESKFGKDVADVERLRQRSAYAAAVERDSAITVVSPLDDNYFSVVANKGSMIWRLLAQKSGAAFNTKIAAALEDKVVTLDEIRRGFVEHKEFLDYSFDQPTDMNLLAGLPQVTAEGTKVALRNTGSIDVTVEVDALLENGQRMSAPTTIRAKSFGDVVFKSAAKVKRVEIDSEKLYPQTDFSDDVAPRELSDSDPLLAVKRFFDKQEYANAEKTARLVLTTYPRFDDVRILLARSLLGLNRTAEAEKEFRAVLDEKLPTARSVGWAFVGLADIAQRGGQNDAAIRFAGSAIRGNAEYGASLLARTIRNKAGARLTADPSVAAFFQQWDRAAVANQKAQLDALVMPGEASRFSSGVAGQTAEWKTDIKFIDVIDRNTVLVEANLAVKLLNRDPESGLAVFRLTRFGESWKIYSVDVFEVR